MYIALFLYVVIIPSMQTWTVAVVDDEHEMLLLLNFRALHDYDMA